MNAKTLEALKGSIAKWEAIVAETAGDNGTDNCPLCQLFFGEPPHHCRGCPVSDQTGEPHCFHTPYYRFWGTRHPVTGHQMIPAEGDPRRATSIAAAQAELSFLKSLLPEGESA
jgi:hypothetical protein